jgi:hypothetical protein
MRSVPGVKMSRAEGAAVVRCRCGAELTRLAPGESIQRGRAASVAREEVIQCGACSNLTKVTIVSEQP